MGAEGAVRDGDVIELEDGALLTFEVRQRHVVAAHCRLLVSQGVGPDLLGADEQVAVALAGPEAIHEDAHLRGNGPHLAVPRFNLLAVLHERAVASLQGQDDFGFLVAEERETLIQEQPGAAGLGVSRAGAEGDLQLEAQLPIVVREVGRAVEAAPQSRRQPVGVVVRDEA